MKKITSHLISEKISSNTAEAMSLFAISRFGEKSNQKIIYSPFEAFYLFQENKMEIKDYKYKILSENELLKKFCKLDKKFETKYTAFKDLRKQGYIVKTALKFGTEFRIYEKGKKIENSHSKWICFVVSEHDKHSWQDFTAKSRVAHSTKKNLLIAIVDNDNDISYYETKWTKI